MSEAVVSVSRLTVHCTVPRDHPHTERVRWRMSEAAGAPLRQALEDVLWPLSASHGPEVVIIRRIELSFDLDTSREVSDVARHWAARLSAALVRFLHGAGATGMVRFESRAHFLARFLVDAAAGRAASKWYYRQFRGLEALAIPAVLRTALLEDVERGIAALRALDPHELVPVLHALGALEARRVIEAVQSHEADASRIESAVEALVPVAPRWRAIAPALDSPWTAALALLVLASDPPIAPLPAIATLAASVAAWLHDQPALPPELAPPGLASLAALPEKKRGALAAAFGKSGAHTTTAREPVSAYTRFGGLILLLPHVAELPIDATFAGGDRPWLRLMVLAACAGVDGARGALADPVLARLCGVSGKEPPFHEWNEDARDRFAAFERAFDPTDADLSWFGADLALAAHHVLRRFARRLPGFSESSPRFLYENFLAFPATIEHGQDVIVCRMGRPPLAALLGITGALRGRIRVPWLPPVDLHSLS